MGRNKKYTHIENLVIACHKNWEENKTKARATEMFLKIKELCKMALISQNYIKKVPNMDIEQVSYEHSTILFERLVTKKLVPISNKNNVKVKRFPWMKYAILTIQETVKINQNNTYSDIDLFLDVDLYNYLSFKDNEYNPALRIDRDFIAEKHDKQSVEKSLNKRICVEKLYKGLLMFYSKTQIMKMYSISNNYIYNQTRFRNRRSMPKEISVFIAILVSLAKRLTHHMYESTPNELVFNKNTNLEKITNSTIRSSVFIAAVMDDNNKFPKELLMSLDVESLYRLCTIKGGQTIQIPTLEHLDSLIGAVVVASNKLIKNKNVKIKTIKESLNLNLTKGVCFDKLVENILFATSNFTDTSTEPLISSLLGSVKKLEECTTSIQNNIKDLRGNEVIEYYTELNKSLNMLTNSFSTISKIMKKSLNK